MNDEMPIDIAPPSDEQVIMAEYHRRAKVLIERIAVTYDDPIVALVKLQEIVEGDLAKRHQAAMGRAVG